MKVHSLKTIHQFFQDVWNEEKSFEIRNNDRNFQIDDLLLLQEYDANNNKYSGREILCDITYILYDFEVEGIMTGFCVIGISIVKKSCAGSH